VPAEIANLFLGATGGVCDDLEQKLISPAAWKRRGYIEGFTILQIRLRCRTTFLTSHQFLLANFQQYFGHIILLWVDPHSKGSEGTGDGEHIATNLPITACCLDLESSLGIHWSAVQQVSRHSITLSATMCFLLHHAYHCHPSSPETLFLPCHLLTAQQLGSHAPTAEKSAVIKVCPRLWEKRISSPNCVGCTATSSSRGAALREKDKEEVRRARR
jgi:hypothetical protein